MRRLPALAALALLSHPAQAELLKLTCTDQFKVTTVDLTIDTQFAIASGHVRTRYLDHPFLEKPTITADLVSFDLKLPYLTRSDQRAHFALAARGLLLRETFPDVPPPPGRTNPTRDPSEQVYRCVRLPPSP